MRPVEVEIQLFREEPEPRKPTIKQAKAFLGNHARRVLGLKPANHNQLSPAKAARDYQKPALRHISSEQAKLFLMGYAMIGNRGAKDLMEVVFSTRGAQPRGSVAGETVAFNPSQVYGRSPAPDCP